MKGFPWYFTDMLSSDDEFELLEKMGVNVVRLGYMWTGAMPSENFFNTTYVDQINAIVEGLGRHGIYTLLDMHEDVLSSKFCLYDGAPLWVVNKSTPKHEFPWPFKGNCSSRGWMKNTLTEAAAHAYQDLYDNHEGMLDDLSDFWARSASYFKDNPWVIGYEIINEPFAGDFYEDPLLLLPGNAGRKNLARMYEAVASSIREHDDEHLIFYEPVTWVCESLSLSLSHHTQHTSKFSGHAT
jgi:endoglycosylceramidase